jgi:cell division protein FtsN
MAKHFARQKPQPKKQHWPLQRILMYILSILVVLAIIVGIRDMKKHTAPIPTKTVAKTTMPATQFDFYSLLPKMKVQSANTVPTNKNTVNLKQQYMLQVASLKNANQANSLIAKLTLLGLSPSTQHYQQNHITWNRVVVGPFNTLTAAQKTQHFLSEQKISALLIHNHD